MNSRQALFEKKRLELISKFPHIIDLKNKMIDKKTSNINNELNKATVSYVPKSNPVFRSNVHPLNNNLHLMGIPVTISNPVIKGDLVTVSLGGGLGNWIFMILAGLGYAEKYGKQFVLSRELLKQAGSGNKQAHELNLEPHIKRIFPGLNYVDSVYSTTKIKEFKEFKYYSLENSWSNVLLQGYFQDEGYFPSASLIPDIRTCYYENTYFVHIRAGDYIGNHQYGIDLIQYYKNCFSMLANVKYIVFSNDNTYAENYMKQFGVSYTISNKENPVDTLIEMANCTGGICANSSFSWLGAFFQGDKRGKVFMPSTWINGKDCSGVYPRWATVINCNIPQIIPGIIQCKIYDIFIKKDIIYVISTLLTDNDPLVKIGVNNTILKEYSINEWEPMRYFCGQISNTDKIIITVNNILYKEFKREDIEHIVPIEKKHKLAFATLFKDDHLFLETTIKHYRKQGVDCFYLYYNGHTLPNNIPSGPDIIYKKWDIQPYIWNSNKWRHNAQTSFLCMFQQKYFEDNEWIILADLDEFIINYSGGTILDLLSRVNSEVIKVRNHWAKLENNTITYSSNNSGDHIRVKSIYRGNFNKFVGIHRPRDNSEKDCLNLRMLHNNTFLHPERISEMRGSLETYLL